MWARALAVPGACLAVLAVCLVTLPAFALLPDGTVLVTRASTVAQRSLPSLLRLPAGTFSALELAEPFALAPYFDLSDLLAYSRDEHRAAVIDPTRFVPPRSRAHYFDPALGDTRAATVIAATAAGSEASFEVGGNVLTLSQLLSPSGSALVFATPVPEPGVGLGLLAGGMLLVQLAKRRVHSATGGVPEAKGVCERRCGNANRSVGWPPALSQFAGAKLS